MSRLRSPDGGEEEGRVAGHDGRDVLLAYLSPVGRVTPRGFILTVLAPVVGLAGMLSVAGPENGAAARLLHAPLYWLLVVGLSKRLHDVGLPGLPGSLPLGLGLWLPLEAGFVFPAWLDTYVYAAVGVACLFAVSTRGQRAPNTYGPEPQHPNEPVLGTCAGRART